MGDIRKGESNEKLIIFHTTVNSQVMVSCVDSRSILHALAHRRAEGGKMLSVMVVRRGRVRGCRREADVLAEREIDAPNNATLYAALRRSSIGPTEAVTGRPGSIHASCCGATNGGCDGLGESLVETPGSAGCHEDQRGTTP